MKKGSKFALGTLFGAGLGVLFAPKSGRETRKLLLDKATELFDQLKEVDVEEIKENIEKKYMEIKKELSSIEKEKVVETAKEKLDVLMNKAEELVELAKKTGKPIVEDATKSIKNAVVDAAKDVIVKLEDKNTKK